MPLSWRQYADAHPRILDAVGVVLLCVAAGPATLYSSLPFRGGGLGWYSVLVPAVLASVATVWRHSHPRLVVLVCAVCASALCGIGYLITPLLLAPIMVALYALAVRVPARTARLTLLWVMAMIVLTALFGDRADHPWPLVTINPIFCLMLPVALGTVVQLRRAYLDAVRARAEHAERTRETEARHRVAEERVRIARELHDVVAHHLALANAQAGTANRFARTRPDQVQPILADLAATTSAALREMKATVGLLRQLDDPDSPLEPAPGLHQLTDLVAAFTSAGLDVTVHIEGTEQPLSAGVDLTAYRIVQESLTNVAKHATYSTAHVSLAYGLDRLTITVTNDASPNSNQSSARGFGLVGMRERAQSAGGQLAAGPRPDGGFTVTTDLPITPRETGT